MVQTFIAMNYECCRKSYLFIIQYNAILALNTTIVNYSKKVCKKKITTKAIGLIASK